MSKNSKPSPKGKPAQKKVTSTPVRNTAIPKAVAKPAPAPAAKPVAKPAAPVASKPASAPSSPPAPKTITHDAISKRAYEIHLSGKGGSETDNWHQAERELRGH